MDHENCSERLPRLVRGELDHAERELVQAHLATCADCSRELIAVEALMALPETELSADERRALHQAVLSPAPRSWARLAPALGALGLLAVVAIGATTFLQGRDEEPAAIQEADSGADEFRLEQDADAGSGRAGEQGVADKAAAEPATAQDSTTAASGAGGVSTETFAAEGRALAPTFSKLQLGPHLLAYDDRDLSLPEAVRRLRHNAPNAGAQLSECAAVVQDAYTSELRPAFASVFPA
ncbi:MAG TPA: zf-HC2 domain-containing protein, partial [Actinomycetota bacterium]|nr:zf-HC2 domain-containing protein [Actinomycetota bacterium]